MTEAFGRAAVRFALTYLRSRYRLQIRVGLGAAVAALALAAYLLTRNAPEG